MADVVLDASAVLAVLNREPGAEAVWACLPGARLSAVNAAEVAAKLVDGGLDAEAAGQSLDRLGTRVVPFEAADVVPVAQMRSATRAAGLSLGDRAGLALGRGLGVLEWTEDGQWRDSQGEVGVRLIRG